MTRLNKKKTAVIFSLIIVSLLTAFAFISASAYSENDPLITLSYIKDILFPNFKEEILEEVDSRISNLPGASHEGDFSQPDFSGTDDNVTKPSQADATYTLLELNEGQTVTANSICEFIVRPGSNVCAVSPFPSQGIADITNGIEVLDGEKISINAYCLIPRGADGRGMTVVSEKAYIMIRGDYTIG